MISAAREKEEQVGRQRRASFPLRRGAKRMSKPGDIWGSIQG